MIIQSLLENDFYNFTMQQAVLRNYPALQAEYLFTCRNKVDLTPIKDRVIDEIQSLCELRFTDDELRYLKGHNLFSDEYLNYLSGFRLTFDKNDIYIKDDQLHISYKGLWAEKILFETPILAIVNQAYYEHILSNGSAVKSLDDCLFYGLMRLADTINRVKQKPSFHFVDFGMRRRFSSQWHDAIVAKLKKEIPYNFVGTSNVYLAKKYDLHVIGTMSHQWIQAGQAVKGVSLQDSQKHMLALWIKQYPSLGVALSDTLGFDYFLKDFDAELANAYGGCRHDSGNPFGWCEKLIKHYKNLDIDPKTKTAVFSDGLTFPLALEIHDLYDEDINTLFGIGTNLTNDCYLQPLQIVIKMVRLDNHPVAKLPDSPGKESCVDNYFIRKLKMAMKGVGESPPSLV